MTVWIDLLRRAAHVAAALGLLALAGCGGAPQPVDSRVVVLGFDGMDPVLARQWMEEGKLPNFSRLAAEGHFQELATSNPPQSPVAWSSFATGKGPGEHGIFDFLRRNPQSYTPNFSISENIPPDRFIRLFGLQVPLGSGEVINRRRGEAFWVKAERDEGARASVLRVPVTYPPDDIHRMLSGMGVPDLLGTQGTYTYYTTTRLGDAGSSTRTVRVRPDRQGRIEADFEGPPDPLLESQEPMRVPLVLTPTEAGANVRLGDDEITLEPGEWSDWIRVAFDVTGPISVTGTVRLLLVQGYPSPRLYVSPIQIDPENPAVEIASPAGYAAELVEDIGLFHTIGMPEETWSLNEEHISDAAWLEMEKTILAEREAMWYETLEKNDSHLVVGAFVQTDRVTHMFYRGLDPEHPRHADTAPEHRGTVEWIYREADRILGETLERLGPEDRLIVISDHGFAPFRKAVHLNRWLVDNGYLALKDGAEESDVIFSSVDWSRSRAYALGLNGLFLNQAGREGQGVVEAGEIEALKAEITEGLGEWADPETGESVVRRVFDGEEAYRGAERGDAPDMVVGYERGYRASWQTTLGAIPEPLMEPNRQKWSGDHCVDPALVPGVLFANFRPEIEVGSIRDVWQLTRRQIREDES